MSKKSKSAKDPVVESEEKPEPPEQKPPEPKPPAKPQLTEDRKKELRKEVGEWNRKIREKGLEVREAGDPDGKLKEAIRKMYDYKRNVERLLRGGPELP